MKENIFFENQNSNKLIIRDEIFLKKIYEKYNYKLKRIKVEYIPLEEFLQDFEIQINIENGEIIAKDRIDNIIIKLSN